MKKNYLDIIDPIHDFIRVYDYELPIIDSPLFQRLSVSNNFQRTFDLSFSSA